MIEPETPRPTAKDARAAFLRANTVVMQPADILTFIKTADLDSLEAVTLWYGARNPDGTPLVNAFSDVLVDQLPTLPPAEREEVP